ncbi:MAG: glycosyltransferase family 4 protein [Clostridia bacterium]|nr:glycosyltransferase family 4 protein [Clostridia bacterium]
MISINMLSKADKIKGQGVLSAHDEQVDLVRNELLEYDVMENEIKFCNIMHYHTINPEYYFTIPFVRRKARTIAYVHFVPETLEKSINLIEPFKTLFYKYMISFYKSVDHLVVVNPYFIDVLAKYGIDKNKITFIPNFVSSNHFYALEKEEKDRIREKYNIKKNSFTVLGVGQLQTRKGVLEFIEIAKNMPNIEFIWAGGAVFGKMTAGYEKIKEKITNDLPSNVHFLGLVEREHMNELYNIANVMFLPSYEELFPMSILEAMCVNIPILLRDLDIYHSILPNYYIKGNNNEEFINEINQLKNNTYYYNQGVEMSKRGGDFYSREHVSSLWREFYHDVSQEVNRGYTS